MTTAELETIFDYFHLSIGVKTFPCKMPVYGSMRHHLGVLASSIIRPFVKGNTEGIILMYLLRKQAAVSGDRST